MSVSDYAERCAEDTPSFSDFLTASQVSAITGLGLTTLDQYRQRWKRGRPLGPAFVRHGRHVFYPRQAVDAWLQQKLEG
ncbi:MAG: helix-turn-helix domain-containing protein [Novosphingobium sp.]|nr:helix-turn-helix domain-containing protein [Novosphingobium sp.]